MMVDEMDHDVGRTLMLEINPTVIWQLQQHRSTAQQRTQSST